MDFGYKIERQKDKPKIAGMILELEVIAKGSDVGYHSGNPILIRNIGTHSKWGRGDNIVHSMDSLSSKLWKQVRLFMRGSSAYNPSLFSTGEGGKML